MKKVFCLFLSICLLAVFAKAQACGYGKGQIAVFNEKDEPINNFKVAFYSVKGLDLTNKTKVEKVKYQLNGWDIYLTQTEAEEFIKDKQPFSSKWNSDEKIVFYKDNTYNYRTRENADVPILVKVSANQFETFYFISPVISGCYYYRKVELNKK